MHKIYQNVKLRYITLPNL